MSGIAKPHARFSTSTTPNVLVNVDFMQTAEKVDLAASPVTLNKPQYLIVINSVFPNGATKETKLNYEDDDTARDAAFTDLVALTATDCA